ncbi:MAG TPA: methyltransferase domain-containing protein [Phycisphaerae bacterium]|nr:methyltransferase domain-containing protein [Phycisphaerae bacterium]HRY69386.1 methyltransferase domain-containing protein [Phycisphaerae bacterium]HSA26253.1 methyltransferase domain-containing protein [Phycisphaerae bacterium]
MSESTQGTRFRGYETRREVWVIAGQTFDLTWPADMDALLDAPRTHQRFDGDGYMPYWAQPWPGAVLLTEAVLAGERGAGRPAVEIGCGVGLVSLAAARAGWSVTASDYDEDAVAFAALNAERNGLGLAGARIIDFRQSSDAPPYDLVLAADLLYERRNGEPIARWVASALRPGGTALLSDPNRSAAEGFSDHARAAGLVTSLVDVETIGPAGLVIRGRIWRLGLSLM